MNTLPRQKVKSGRPQTSDNPRTGRAMARYWYELEPLCARCLAGPAVDRHHIDGNPLNNEADNIQSLCRRCHMHVDGRINAKRTPATHCKRGHAFDEQNTYTYSSGKRCCKTCRRDRQAGRLV